MATVMMPSGTIAASGMTTRGLRWARTQTRYTFYFVAGGEGGPRRNVRGAWSNMILRTLNKRGPAHSGNRRRQAT